MLQRSSLRQSEKICEMYFKKNSKRHVRDPGSTNSDNHTGKWRYVRALLFLKTLLYLEVLRVTFHHVLKLLRKVYLKMLMLLLIHWFLVKSTKLNMQPSIAALNQVFRQMNRYSPPLPLIFFNVHKEEKYRRNTILDITKRKQIRETELLMERSQIQNIYAQKIASNESSYTPSPVHPQYNLSSHYTTHTNL